MSLAHAATGDNPLSLYVLCSHRHPTANLRKENYPNVSLVYSSVPIMQWETHKGATCNERS